MHEPLIYHLKIRDYFFGQKKTWEFFASAKTKKEQINEYKIDLLKNCYKFDPSAEKEIYEKVERVKAALRLDLLQVTVYQSQNTEEVNASVVYFENEACLVFSGPILRMLNDDELLSVIAHELSHIQLYNLLSGDLEITDRIITAIANNPQSEGSYFETARLFKLYTEIFCDRGALIVLGKTEPVITSLVKIATSLDKVNAESYVRQAEEIFTTEKNTKAATVSHPENFIRARAIHLWHTGPKTAEKEITRMIEGVADLDQLDILKQIELSKLTRKFLQLFLKPKWFRTNVVKNQALQFFPDFAGDEQALFAPEILDQVEASHHSIKEYLCYLLLDFILVDQSLEIVPFGWGFQFAEEIGLKKTFDEIVTREFKYSLKKLQQHKQKSLEAYYAVKESASEQIYQD
ncbi:M48 family metalloprotease [Pollutibacter soli]|uniref:M48 family metalloprotease n=1 Tax=Pollutibacter soli TaxID=3034157 RepID=UPI0030139B44